MNMILLLLAAMTPAAAAPSAAPTMEIRGKHGDKATVALAEAADEKLVSDAEELLLAHKPADALALVDKVIAEEEARYAGEKRLVFCARSMTEAVLYAGMGAEAKKDTLVLGATWARAIFLKGFALIDSGDPDAARPLLERAVELAPMNAYFLGELAEWHKSHKDWPTAYATFERALSAAEFAPDDRKNKEQRRALRGMGFVLSEQRRFDEAEKLFRRCLELDPTDENAKRELDYIRQQRQRSALPTS